MTSGQDVSEYLDTLVLVKSYFFKFFWGKKNKKNREFFFVVLRRHPEDESICLFAGLLPNPDVSLSLQLSVTRLIIKGIDNQDQKLNHQYEVQRV
jgi:hypothetical protein